jgi:thiamine kinase-like enzyme
MEGKSEINLISAEIHAQLLKYYGDYLGGSWSNLSHSDVRVEILPGSGTNYLFHIILSDNIKRKSKLDRSEEPSEVVLRLYGKKHFNNGVKEIHERFDDRVVSVTMSEHKIGPHIYALFPKGEIQEYILSHNLGRDEETNPAILSELARKIAIFHLMKMPLKKESSIFDNMLDMYSKSCERFPIEDFVKRLNLETLRDHNLVEEVKWMAEYVKRIGHTNVFCHNDFRHGNIMVREKPFDSKDTIVISDYEYSSYGPRGFDFGTLFMFWNAYNFDVLKTFAPDEIIKQFLEVYIDECVRLKGVVYGKQNNLEKLMMETRVGHLIELLFCVNVQLYLNVDKTRGEIRHDKDRLMVIILVTKIDFFLKLFCMFTFERMVLILHSQVTFISRSSTLIKSLFQIGNLDQLVKDRQIG